MTRRHLASVTAAIGIALGTFATPRASAPGGNWPQWRGPHRDGVSTETGLLQSWPAGGPPLLYTVTGLGRGFSTVSISNGRIFTMGDRRGGQFVIALDEENGKELWATRVGSTYVESDDYSGPRGAVTVDGDLLYVLDTDADIVAIESATGKERWRKNLERDFGGRMMSQWNWAESPLVDGDRVLVTPGSAKAGIVALNKLTGKEIFLAPIPRSGSNGSDGAGYSSIVISNGGGVKQYVQMMGRGLVSLRASDGWLMWTDNSVANNIANISTPVIKDNFVFASTSYDAGSVLMEISSAPDGRVTAREKYNISPGRYQNHHGGTVLVGDYLYGGHGQSRGVPVCIELTTGKLMWPQVRNAGEGSAAVLAADGKLYFRYQNGLMMLLDASPSGYHENGSFMIPNVRNPSWSHPVIAAGRLYLREQDALHVYNVKK